ncbi:tetratricopeptide repeat protein [Sorangium sp. So ce341]|uniref:tetratricopeptide repeat protein n=1 Tax=Sorangium sp. So ce341 TaxID=3133302 RepID=UPI003F603151
MRWIIRRRVGHAGLGVKLLVCAALLGGRAAPAQAEPQAPARAAPQAPARAEPQVSGLLPSPVRPWHQGVSEERKHKAEQLFQEGRELHRSLMLGDAREKYEEALRYWEHPELRLYLGRVLMRIGLPLLAYENLEQALQWGAGSLSPPAEAEARAAMRELMQQELAVIQIRCDEPGAKVHLDGNPWFACPGVERRLVTPGEHVVTGNKAGFYLVVKPVVVLAGKRASGTIRLSEDATVTERRWQAAWAPWAVVGAGAALGLLGGGLVWRANVLHDDAQRQLQRDCGPSCPTNDGGAYDQSLLENRVAIGSFIAGGAALIAGGVLVYMNTPRTYRTEDRGEIKVELAPAVSASAAGLSTRISF